MKTAKERLSRIRLMVLKYARHKDFLFLCRPVGKMNNFKKFIFLGFLTAFLFLSLTINAQAQLSFYDVKLAQAMQLPADSSGTVIETEIDARSFAPISLSRPGAEQPPFHQQGQAHEDQMTRINKSLKHLIDENQRILREKEKLEESLQRMRGERMIQDNRLTAFVEERQQLLKQSEEVQDIKQKYQQRIEELESELELRRSTPEFHQAQRIQNLLDVAGHAVLNLDDFSAEEMEFLFIDESSQEEISLANVDLPAIRAMAQRIAEEKIKKEKAHLIEQNQVLKKDAIKLHYNLANLFFEQGRYELAASEYRRVSQLMPQDSATHYNLAFVAENYLNDLETALRHYTRYIQLEPEAPDAVSVKNRISRIKLQLRAKIDSILD